MESYVQAARLAPPNSPRRTLLERQAIMSMSGYMAGTAIPPGDMGTLVAPGMRQGRHGMRHQYTRTSGRHKATQIAVD